MSTVTHVTPTGTTAVPVSEITTVVQDILVAYDAANDTTTATPGQVNKGTSVRFRDANGGQLKIMFLSPTGTESAPVLDSQVSILVIGGTYHIKCVFTPTGTTQEISPQNGVVLDVVPQRP